MATHGGNSDGPPHPNAIGKAFVKQYYTVLNSSPGLVHKFYHDESTLGRAKSYGALKTVTTTDAINEYFLSTELKDCEITLEDVVTQPSLADGVLIVVTGFFTMPDTVKHRFTQSFFLAPQETGGYFVLNDVLRYVRDMSSAEPETTSVKESMNPELPFSVNGEVINPSVENIPVNNEVTGRSVESISVNNEVINSIRHENSQVKNGVIKIPEAAPAPPASKHNDVTKKSYASIVKTKNESTQPAPITNPKPRPKPTVKRAENVEKSSPVPAKTTHVDQGYSIYVKNLPPDANVEIVEAEFRKFGAIKPHGIQVVHRQDDGFCFGFVEFESRQSMYAAIEAARVRFGTYVSFVEEKRTPKRGINNVTHSNNNGNAWGSQVLPGRGGHGDNFKGRGASFVNNGNNRDANNSRCQGANFVNNNNYHDGGNFRGHFVNNYHDGNNMRNESRNQNEYSGCGRGLQGNGYCQNEYHQNGNDYRQNRDGGYNQKRDGGYNQNRDGGYNQNREGRYNQNRDGYRKNVDDDCQNGNGYHQPQPVHNEKGSGNGRPGRFNVPKQIPIKRKEVKGMDAAASSSLSREDKQKADEKAMEDAVQAEMRKVLGQGKESDPFLSKKKKALQDASLRSMLEKRKQYSIETLPRFQIDMNCTPDEMDNFIEERRFRFQIITSFQMVNKVVATPPKIHITHQLVEVMKTLEDGKTKISVMQFIINEYDNYVAAFRPTPPGNPYQPNGFFTFKDLLIKLPDYLGSTYITEHIESYTATTKVELRPGYLKLMVQRLQESFTVHNYMYYLAFRVPYLEAPMILFGECQRSAEVLEAVRGTKDGLFGLITDPLDTSDAAVWSYVTLAMDTLFHNWSALSKIGLLVFIAILEIDMGLMKDALYSFIQFRIHLRRCVHKMAGKGPARVDLKLFDDNGNFSLKQLLGRYLTLVKLEEDLVVRCVMRTRTRFQGTYDGFGLSEENMRLKHLWDTCDRESDDECDVRVPYRSDKTEWQRWCSIKEKNLSVLDELMR